MLEFRSTLAGFVFVTLFTNAAMASDAWPTFRGPSGDGIALESEVPSEWSQDKNIDWRRELPGQGWSSPVVGDGKIFVSAAIPVEQEEDSFDLSLIIIDATTGSILESVSIMRQTGERWHDIHQKNSHASPTPILDGDRIYVHFGYQGTACLKRSGEVVWKNRDLFFKPTHGNGGTPLLIDGKLVFTCDGDKEPKVVALDANSGKIVWETPRPVDASRTFSFCTPTLIEVDGVQQIIAPGSDCVLALAPSDGKVIWDVRYDGYSVVPKPVFHRGRLYLSTGFNTASILAIDPTGTGVVTDTHIDWQHKKFVPKTPSMIAHEGRIYSVSDNGIMTNVDAETGDIVYRQRLGGNYSASPILVNDRIYLTNEAGKTTVVAIGDEYDEIATCDLGERTLASPAVAGNAIIMRTADALYRISE